MTNAIEIHNLGKQYRRREIGKGRYKTLRESLTSSWWKRSPKNEDDFFWALRHVDLEIPKGEIVGVIGPNGAGKSTLLKLLTRVTAPTEGDFTLRGRVASLLEVGTGFHPELTGRENIFLSGAIMGMRKEEIKRKFDEIVAFSGVEQFLDLPVKRYSSGMFVRLGFAVAAHLEAEILLVDEVLAVGDAEFQKKCLGKMGNVAQNGRTVLFVSHNLGAVRKLCKNSIFIIDGKIKHQGSTFNILDAYDKDISKEKFSSLELYQKNKTKAITGISINSIGIIDKKNEYLTNLNYGSKIRVKIIIISLIEHSNINLILGLNDFFGTRILTSSSLDIGLAFELKKGSNVFIIEIPNLKIKPGIYGLYASVVRNFNDRFDSFTTKPFFKILDQAKNKKDYKGYWGAIVIDAKWKKI